MRFFIFSVLSYLEIPADKKFDPKMAHDLNEEQVSIFKEVFTLFEKDDENFISAKDLGTVLRLLGMRLTDNEVDDIMVQVDIDNNGRIEFSEFLLMMDRKMKDSGKKEKFYEVFCQFDHGQKGYISYSDISAAMAHLGEKLEKQQIIEMMEEAGINNDGKISFKVFTTLLEAHYINMNKSNQCS